MQNKRILILVIAFILFTTILSAKLPRKLKENKKIEAIAKKYWKSLEDFNAQNALNLFYPRNTSLFVSLQVFNCSQNFPLEKYTLLRDSVTILKDEQIAAKLPAMWSVPKKFLDSVLEIRKVRTNSDGTDERIAIIHLLIAVIAPPNIVLADTYEELLIKKDVDGKYKIHEIREFEMDVLLPPNTVQSYNNIVNPGDRKTHV